MNDASSTSKATIRHLEIPLRDGVRLSALLYVPDVTSLPRPAIVMMTPYTVDSLHARGRYFSDNGYVCALVDVRGRGDSEGEFSPFSQEACDGYDVVEWIAARSECDGQVAMCGSSYHGYVQWVTAKEQPPHLKTIVPTAAPFLGVDFPKRNNIFYPFVARWLTYVFGRASHAALFNDDEFWLDLFSKWYVSGRPLTYLSEMLGENFPILENWLSHPTHDAFWESHNPSDDEYARMALPVLTITGIYDDDQLGALEHYRRHVAMTPPEVRNQHYLVIGPWDHGGATSPQSNCGGLPVSAPGILDLYDLRRRWYDWILGGANRPTLLEDRVSYYITDIEQWAHASSLDSVTSGFQEFQLSPLSGKKRSHPRPTEDRDGGLESTEYEFHPGTIDHAYVAREWSNRGGAVLEAPGTPGPSPAIIYSTPTLTRDLFIAGFFRLTVWLSINVPDTDIYVSVYDEAPDGSRVRLTTDTIRSRYRADPSKEVLLSGDEACRYEFRNFLFTARRIRTGHRLRLYLAPRGHSVDAPYCERNMHTGGRISTESINDAKLATVRLAHGEGILNTLYVPLSSAF